MTIRWHVLLLLISLTTVVHAQQRPGPLEAKLEMVSAAPLPLQAVRLKFSLTHTAYATVIEEVRPPEKGIGGYLWIKRPGEEEFQRPRVAIEYFGHETDVRYATDSDREDWFRLYRREQTSLEFALGADWPHKLDLFTAAMPLLDKPGKYVVQIRYQYNVTDKTPEQVAVAECIIEVPEPEGVDKEVYELLRDDRETTGAMLSLIHSPPDHAYEVMQELVAKYPHSSYTDYARLALARRELNGTGFPGYSEDYTWERAEKAFRLVLASPNDDGHVATVVARMVSQRKVGHQREKIIADVVSVRRDPALLEKELPKLVELAFVSPERRRSAIRHTRSVFSQEFAYRPAAMVMEHLAADGLDQRTADAAARQLDEQYPASLEWIRVRNRQITLARPWRDFRVQFLPYLKDHE